MADDIVQTIKVEVEGGDEAAAALEKVGESATRSFEETEKAAQTAGVSIEDFGRLSEKTQAAYVELSQRVSEGSKDIVESTGQLGGGLDDVSKKSGLSRGEMRALGSVMKQLGVGEVAGLAMQFNKMLAVFGTVGVAVLAAAMGFNALMKSMKEAKEASESVDRLSKVFSDTPEQLKGLQSAFKAAGVSIADFEKGFESLAFKVIERSANIAEAASKSSKTVIDAQLAAAKAAQAISPTPGLFDAEIKRLEIAQKQEAATLANAQAAKSYENSLAALVPQLDRAAEGQKTMLDAGVKTESITDAIIQRFAQANQSTLTFVSSTGEIVTVAAKAAQSIGTLSDNLKAGAPSAAKMGDELNKMFNALDPAAQAKMKAGLKGVIPDSLLNQITTTTEKYQKLKEAADEAVKFDASPAGKTMKAFDDAVAASIKTVEGWGQTLKQKFAEVLAGWKAIGTGAVPLSKLFEEAGRIIVQSLGSIGSAIAEAVSGWVTTAVPKAWEWIKDAFWSIADGIVTKANDVKNSIVAFVTTALPAAWEWLKSTFFSAVDALMTKANETKDFITSWVTTAVPGAWEWLKSTFFTIVDGIIAKANQAKDFIGSSLFGGGQAAAPAGGDIPGKAAGGLLGGRGTGTSDSNLAWVSRGEYITPARAVAQPGVLAFLEALRRSGGNLRDVLDGMGRFALGGMVRAPLAIPAFAGGGMNAVTINFPGLPEITGLRASSGALDELRKAAAMAQVRSGGRKPSRYS